MKRRAEYPDLHVYHYAPYEPSAMKRLMGEHHTRESEIDELLRGEVFVDLYAVVRSAVRIGSESYSLKQVEKLYMQRPAGEVMDGGGSIVAYEQYLEHGEQQTLDEIEELQRGRLPVDARPARLVGGSSDRSRGAVRPDPAARGARRQRAESVTERELVVAALSDQLLADASDDELHPRWLLAQMLDWHRREAKPDWWMFFARQKMSDDELLDDRECISGLTYVGDVEQVKRSTVQRYAFAPQDHKFKVGETPCDPVNGERTGEVMAVDDVAGTIDLKRGPKALDGAHPQALIPSPPIDNTVAEAAIQRLAEHVIAHGLHAPGPYRAALDLLLRTRRDPDAGPFDRSYLAIQGPPGSGKTTKGAELIVELVQAGKRVGITAHSHAVIGNLLEAVAKRGADMRALQKAKDHQRCRDGIAECTDAPRGGRGRGTRSST